MSLKPKLYKRYHNHFTEDLLVVWNLTEKYLMNAIKDTQRMLTFQLFHLYQCDIQKNVKEL